MYDDHNRGHGEHRGGGGGGGGRGRGRGPDREGRGTPLAELDPALTEVSRRLIGCAIEVHKGLGPGFDKAVYHRALEVEMGKQNPPVPFKSNQKIPVVYGGQEVGTRHADLVIDNRFIVELLALRGEIGGTERAATRALLRAADMELGLIINFAERRLKDGLVRVLNPDKLNAMKGEGGEHHDEDGGFEDDAPHS